MECFVFVIAVVLLTLNIGYQSNPRPLFFLLRSMPLRDTNFLLNEVMDFPSHYKKFQSELSKEIGGDEEVEPLTPDFVDMINKEAAKFSEEVVAPLYGPGDVPCDYKPNGDVITPAGYKEAYKEFSEAGWNGLTVPVQYGGQGMPMR